MAPFSGWYGSSEIGGRNLSDESRYDMLPAVARAMGLDTTRSQTPWKDRAVVELTYAVQASFTRANVHIVDHHQAAEQFVRHCEREAEAGRQTATDWSWVNPPISASTTPTFHRSFDPADFTLPELRESRRPAGRPGDRRSARRRPRTGPEYCPVTDVHG